MDIKDEIPRPPQCYGMTILCWWSRDDDKSATIFASGASAIYSVFILAVTVIYYFSRDISYSALRILEYFSRDIAGMALNRLKECLLCTFLYCAYLTRLTGFLCFYGSFKVKKVSGSLYPIDFSCLSQFTPVLG